MKLKPLNKEDFNLKLIADLKMVDRKRTAVLECPYCLTHFNVTVTQKSKDQQSCIKCRPKVVAAINSKKREEAHKNTTHKVCLSCRQDKEIINFSLRKASGDGYAKVCRDCAKESKDQYSQTKIGLLTQLYNSQRANSKLRGHTMPTYTRQDLIDKYLHSRRFISYYSKWEDSGFVAYFDGKPSFDRINDHKPYSLDNIRLTTYKKNFLKEHLKYIIGASRNSAISPVIQIGQDGAILTEYYSINEAERATGIKAANISKVCRELRNTAGGFKWKYKLSVTTRESL